MIQDRVDVIAECKTLASYLVDFKIKCMCDYFKTFGSSAIQILGGTSNFQ